MSTLDWIGKKAVLHHHQEVPYHLLRDVPELGCGPEEAGNLIVEGDNLTALKALSAAHAFAYDPDRYPLNRVCLRSGDFKKHYYRQVGDLKEEGEEFECALFLDRLPQVEVWVRNLERQPEKSFWLPTATDRFYPDFVCRLTDGRTLVVEYKGEDRWSNDDSKEKRRLGELWAERSAGTCLFVMPKGSNLAAITAAIEPLHS